METTEINGLAISQPNVLFSGGSTIMSRTIPSRIIL